MTAKVPETARLLTDDGLGLILGGRLYGAPESEEHLCRVANMPVPTELDSLRNVLASSSRLLALHAESGTQAIYDAFGQDLLLMARYREAFRKTIEAAVRARAKTGQGDAKAFVGDMAAQIADITYEPSLELDAEAAKLPAPELLERLQTQFRADIDSFATGVATWLHLLAERECVSLVDWVNPRAAKLHFFLLESTVKDLGSTVHDPGRNLRGRTVTTTTIRQVDIVTERRVHTLLNAATHQLSDYPRRVPERIARLIDEIPSEIKPFVTIVDGQVSNEEVHRRGVSSEVKIKKRSVWVDDPAPVLFGTWALGGWGGSLEERATSVYQGHALARANKWLVGHTALIAVAALGGAVAGGTRAALAAGAIAGVISIFHQIGLRFDKRR